jgi:hypothetical protein
MAVLDRFRRIERSRREAPAAEIDSGGATAERIEGVERPGAVPAPQAASGADLERFEPAAPPPVELLPEDANRRPFTRCMRCGMDHNLLAAECAGCGAPLDTPEQRAFNERLWAERQAERAEEERLHLEREAERVRDAEALAASQRAMGEALARQVGERERRRLEADGWDGGIDALGTVFLWIGSGAAAIGRLVRRLVSPGPR